MSWNISATNVTADDAEQALEAEAETWIPNESRSPQETVEQMMRATFAAVGILRDGVVGKGPFNVRLNGHANPGHVTVAGWSRDTITITIESAV